MLGSGRLNWRAALQILLATRGYRAEGDRRAMGKNAMVSRYAVPAPRRSPPPLVLATPIADLTGVRTWYLAGGMACMVLGASTFLVRPIMEMEGLPAIETGQD